jgi:GxxExxY protein
MIYYKDECYKIIGAAMKVHRVLGAGFLEAVYQEALEIEIQRLGIPYEREKELQINYDGVLLHQQYKADFLCYDNIIVELKAVTSFENIHRVQTINYLKATGCKLGLLINFGNQEELIWERIVF